jgi:hypothetical protein
LIAFVKFVRKKYKDNYIEELENIEDDIYLRFQVMLNIRGNHTHKNRLYNISFARLLAMESFVQLNDNSVNKNSFQEEYEEYLNQVKEAIKKANESFLLALNFYFKTFREIIFSEININYPLNSSK